MKTARTYDSLLKGSLEGEPDVPKHRRLYYALRDAILDGRLAAGAALPSTRAIATKLKVSRNTVMTAFDQLIAEGFVEPRVGAGSFVSESLSPEQPPVRAGDRGSVRRPAVDPTLSRRGRALAAQRVRAAGAESTAGNESTAGGEANLRPFRAGTPALDEFPFALWARLTTHCIKHAPRTLLTYSDSAGYRPLREAVAGYLAAARAVRCTPDQVIITVGSQQALDLTARLVLDPGDPVWIEDPGYRGARAALSGNEARLVAVPLDEHGIDVETGIAREPRPRLVYVTPSSQFPMGVTMSLDRRRALLSFAKRAGAWIFEDDYDSEFRYVGRPIAALQGLDDSGRVIYAGTFSKVLFPGLRLGYVVAPANLADAFVCARSVSDRQPSGIEQAVVSRFLDDGHFARHLRRMRVLYAERQAVFVDAARRSLRGLLDVNARATGMHLLGMLPTGTDDVAAAARAAACGVDVVPLSGYFMGRPSATGFVLGYTSESETAIANGVARLRAALSR